jgi:hypothetical protein
LPVAEGEKAALRETELGSKNFCKQEDKIKQAHKAA